MPRTDTICLDITRFSPKRKASKDSHVTDLSPPGPSPVQQRHPDIAALVEAFYARARADALLGPVFAAVVQDWPHHLLALTGFWAAQLRGRGSYRGQPISAHRAMAERLRPDMFARWLELWQQTTTELMSPEDAAILQAKAAHMAKALQTAVFAP